MKINLKTQKRVNLRPEATSQWNFAHHYFQKNGWYHNIHKQIDLNPFNLSSKIKVTFVFDEAAGS